MEKYIVKTTGLLLFLILFTSCLRFEPYYFVFKGNNDFKKGDFQSANVEYLKSAKYEEYSAWISYNLGTVYNALGENDAAQEEWEKVVLSRNKDLEFLSTFNLGTVYYKQGRYEEAFNSFRNALILVPESNPAKINLEYTLQKLQAKGGDQDKVPPQLPGGSRFPDEINRILEYIQRKEEYIWRSPDTVEPSKEVLDW